jgi:uncharacterized Zn finger protein
VPWGESAYELSECFDIIFAALAGSSLDTAELLLWALNLDLQDDYGICGDAATEFLGRKHRKSAWSVVADQLRKRLAEGSIKQVNMKVYEDSIAHLEHFWQSRLMRGFQKCALRFMRII